MAADRQAAAVVQAVEADRVAPVVAARAEVVQAAVALVVADRVEAAAPEVRAVPVAATAYSAARSSPWPTAGACRSSC